MWVLLVLWVCSTVRVSKGAREARENDPQNQHNPSPYPHTRWGAARDWQTRSQRDAETAMTRSISCACGHSFRARQTGGRAQRFCRPACRRIIMLRCADGGSTSSPAVP